MGLRAFTPMVIACPGCGRTTSDYFQHLAQDIQGLVDSGGESAPLLFRVRYGEPEILATEPEIIDDAPADDDEAVEATAESGLELLQRELGGRKIAEFDTE